MKKLLSVIIAIFLMCFFAVSAFSFTDEELELSGANELSEFLSEETLDYMKKLGCEEIEFEKMLGVSPTAIFELFSELVKMSVKNKRKRQFVRRFEHKREMLVAKPLIV